MRPFFQCRMHHSIFGKESSFASAFSYDFVMNKSRAWKDRVPMTVTMITDVSAKIIMILPI